MLELIIVETGFNQVDLYQKMIRSKTKKIEIRLQPTESLDSKGNRVSDIDKLAGLVRLIAGRAGVEVIFV